MGSSKRILIITSQSLKPIKFFIDQMPKLAKGLIRLGHDVRIVNYSQLLRAASSFKSRRLSAYLYKKKVDQEIARLAVHYQPDIVYISFAKYLDSETVKTLRKACPQAVFIGGDGDPWPSLKLGRIETAKSLDFLIATNNGRFLEEYRAAGVKNCHFMPNICDPDIDYRYSVGDEWKSDILWTGTTSHSAGNNDCSREDIITAIEPLPNTRIYGCLGRPQIGGKDYLKAISGARLGIHVNAANDVSMYHSDRLTHYLACGTCVLSKHVPDSEKLFRDKEHLAYFETVDELKELIDYYLANENERARLANQGMTWLHQEYNCKRIAQYILDLIENGYYVAPWNLGC
ncbi:MAG: glycosyltransferase family 1 protein [Deltaproteobacteria bacterium]|nr:glycosyltransferase family 1 protein [Deltaproteobacteria bacterium]